MALGGYRPGAGRKKGYAAIEAERQRKMIAEKLSTEFAPIVDKAIEQAKTGDRASREWLADRAFGRPQQFVDHTTDGEQMPAPIYGGMSANEKDDAQDSGHDGDTEDISSQEKD